MLWHQKRNSREKLGLKCSKITSQIAGVDENLICRIKIMLEVITCDSAIDSAKCSVFAHDA